MVYQDKASELQLNALERKSYLTTDAVFPSGLPLPEALQEARAGFLARHLLGGGWVAGVSASLGSWDERPFTDTAHPIISAGGFVRMPAGGENAWIFSLSYSNESVRRSMASRSRAPEVIPGPSARPFPCTSCSASRW